MATAAAAAELPRTRAPRRLYVGLALLAIAIVVAGFWRTYFGPLLAGAVDKPSIIHVHAVIYVGWLAIFLAQALLAATGRVAAHMKLGRLATSYGVLVIGAGLLAAFGMFVLRVRAGEVADAQRRLVGPLLDMLVFAPLFAAAIYYRRKPELHKRLMIVATTALLIAAVGRIPFPADLRIPLVYLLWIFPILAAMAHDFWRQRRVHPVYVLGLFVLVLEGPISRRIVGTSEQWRDLTARLATWVA
jgi:hypothetical protein